MKAPSIETQYCPEPTKGGESMVRWIATCPDDTKGVLAKELIALGVPNPKPMYRGVAFEADLATAYRAHLWLRTASRIQRIVAVIPAGSLDALAQGVADVSWSEWLRAQRPFTVSPILTDEAARALQELPVKDAVAAAVSQRFQLAAMPAPRFDPDANDPVNVMAHIRAGVCTLGMDTAGRALHKRGWRVAGHPAVLKETLASAILMLAGYDGTEALLDPMCGSGTLAIEGAYIALGKAPLIHRGKDDFGFEHQAGFDRALWRKVSDQARAAKRDKPAAPVFASDIRESYVQLARQTALRARVEKHIQFTTASFQTLQPPADKGLLVANLPYGERIGKGTVPELFRDVGKLLRGPFKQWRAALLVPADTPKSALGMPWQREIPLMNGALEVKLLLLGG